VSDAVARYLEASQANDVEAILETLAPDAQLISPISGRMSFSGREDLRILVSAIYGGISNLRWGKQSGDETTRFAIGTFSIGPLSIDDAMVFELAPDGRIARVRPHIRPWLGLSALALTLGPRLALHPGVLLRALRHAGR
jgi:SnoaL-like domain